MEEADKWVLLWSQSQCAFHVESEADMLKANARAFLENRRMDYVPLWTGTADECFKVADEMRPRLRIREMARNAQQVTP